MVAVKFKNQEEYDAYMSKHRAGGGGSKVEDQHIMRDGKPFKYPQKIPANQQAARDLRAQKRKEQDTFEKRHPRAHKVVSGLKKVGHAAREGANRYFEEEARSQRTAGEITRAGVESHRGTWINPGRPYHSIPGDHHRKPVRPMNDIFYVSVPPSAGHAGGGVGSLGILASTHPGSSLPGKKKKTTRRQRRSYD